MWKNNLKTIDITCKKLSSAISSRASSIFFNMIMNDAFPWEETKNLREKYLKIFNKIKDFQVLDEYEKNDIENVCEEECFQKSYEVVLQKCKVKESLHKTYDFENIKTELYSMIYNAEVMSSLEGTKHFIWKTGNTYLSYEWEDGKTKKIEELETIWNFIFARVIRTWSLVILRTENRKLTPLVDYKKWYCDYEISNISEDDWSVVYTTNRGVNLLVWETHIAMSEDTEYFTRVWNDFYIDRREWCIYKVNKNSSDVHTTVMPKNIGLEGYYNWFIFCIFLLDEESYSSYRLYDVAAEKYIEAEISTIKHQTEQWLYILSMDKNDIIFLDNKWGHSLVKQDLPESIWKDNFSEFIENYLDTIENPYSDVEEEYDT